MYVYDLKFHLGRFKAKLKTLLSTKMIDFFENPEMKTKEPVNFFSLKIYKINGSMERNITKKGVESDLQA